MTATRRKWTRFDTGRDVGYQTEGAQVFDNGNGIGSARNSGRWAVEVHGKWIANVDYLADAKALAERLTR